MRGYGIVVPRIGQMPGPQVWEGRVVDDETWTSDEFGASHQGRVGVLLDDGTLPKPVYFDGSFRTGHDVAHWSVYDGGTWPERPRAAVLRAE